MRDVLSIGPWHYADDGRSLTHPRLIDAEALLGAADEVLRPPGAHQEPSEL